MFIVTPELVDVLVDRGGPPRKRRDMARMRYHLEFIADKERIYEGAVLPSRMPASVEYSIKLVVYLLFFQSVAALWQL